MRWNFVLNLFSANSWLLKFWSGKATVTQGNDLWWIYEYELINFLETRIWQKMWLPAFLCCFKSSRRGTDTWWWLTAWPTPLPLRMGSRSQRLRTSSLSVSIMLCFFCSIDLWTCDLDDVVLDDIYQYHLPPTRRVPPLLWARIRSYVLRL